MNNSPCSGWCAPANGRHSLEQTAGLPLMSLSRLSRIVLVLNHPFPPAQTPQAHSLWAANGLNSVTAQRHLLIKTKTQLHQCKPAFKGVSSCLCHSKIVLHCWCVSWRNLLPQIFYFQKFVFFFFLIIFFIFFLLLLLLYVCMLELSLCSTLIWKYFLYLLSIIKSSKQSLQTSHHKSFLLNPWHIYFNRF